MKKYTYACGNRFWTFAIGNPMTTCEVFEDGKLIASGWSRCHPEDTYSESTGIKLTLEMVKEKYHVVMPKYIRRRLITAFSDHFNEPIGDFTKRWCKRHPEKVIAHESGTVGWKWHGNYGVVRDWFGVDRPLEGVIDAWGLSLIAMRELEEYHYDPSDWLI